MLSTKTSVKENQQTLKVRTNLFQNKAEKFNPNREMIKGNCTPITTQAGRISSGIHGVIWAGKLNAWSVWMDETREWSPVMGDIQSPTCGLVGILVGALQELEAIRDEDDEVKEAVTTLLDTDVVFDIPGLSVDDLFSPDNDRCLYEVLAETPLHLEGEIELSIGVKSDGSLSIKGTFIGDVHALPGKVSLVESNRIAIGRAFSSFAKSIPVNPEDQKARLKGALKSQRQKNQERRARYSKPDVTANEVNTAGVDTSLPPIII